MEEILHVAFACDEAYVPFTAVALWSLMEHHHGRVPVQAHVLDDAISENSQFKMKQLEKNFPFLKLHFHSLPEAVRSLPVTEKYPSPAVYARIFLPEILPESPRILYLDSDTLVLGEWESLYHSELGGHAFAARSERGVSPLRWHNRRLGRPQDADYFNVGVLLIEPIRWRSEGLTERLVALIRARGPFDFPEQDPLNILAEGQFCPLQPRWNRFDYRTSGSLEEMSIVHFIYQKPWKAFSEKLEAQLARVPKNIRPKLPRRWDCYYLTHLFWQTAFRTPFAEEFQALREAAKRTKPVRGFSPWHSLSCIERFFRKAIRDPLRRHLGTKSS